MMREIGRGFGVRILHNKIMCLLCDTVIESTYTHDFKFCSCGAVAVDGGKDYLRRVGNENAWEEMSEVEEDANVAEQVKEFYFRGLQDRQSRSMEKVEEAAWEAAEAGWELDAITSGARKGAERFKWENE